MFKGAVYMTNPHGIHNGAAESDSNFMVPSVLVNCLSEKFSSGPGNGQWCKNGTPLTSLPPCFNMRERNSQNMSR